jgi:dipeptidyl aminopeptidase/acylaminoacyl peptidase
LLTAVADNRWVIWARRVIAHVSGTGLGQITSGRRPANDPAFAPDGTQLAFARLGSGLFVVNVDGSALRWLTGNGFDRYPVWSPNGRLIAFVRGAGSGYHLWVMSANGKRQHRLRQAPSTAGRAAWTPDGESLIIRWGVLRSQCRDRQGAEKAGTGVRRFAGATLLVALTGRTQDRLRWSPPGAGRL